MRFRHRVKLSLTMARSTKVIGFSLPPQLDEQISAYARSSHKTRSELMREMIEQYFQSQESPNSTTAQAPDISAVARAFWEHTLRPSDPSPLFVCSLILRHPTRKQILICERATTDQLSPRLRWSFPGGGLSSILLTDEAENTLRRHTGLRGEVWRVISARVHPDTHPDAQKQIVSVYVAATAHSVRPTLSDKYSRYKWVDPLDVFSYFSTSVSDEVASFLRTLA